METDKVSFVTEVRYNNSHVFSNSQHTGTFHKHPQTEYIKEFVVVRNITQVFLVIGIFGVKVVGNSIFQNLLVLFVKDAPIRWTCHNEINAVAFQAWQNGAGICIEPFDGQAFADTIEKVYNMTPEERKKYGDNARKYILENNTLEKLTEKYISILER